MSTHVVKFERIGRRRDVAPLTITSVGSDPDDLAEVIHTYAGKFLLSKGYEVHVEMGEDGSGSGRIYAGFQMVGGFTLDRIDQEGK